MKGNLEQGGTPGQSNTFHNLLIISTSQQSIKPLVLGQYFVHIPSTYVYNGIHNVKQNKVLTNKG